EQVRLDRLSINEVAAMVSAIYGAQPASAVIEALYTRTGGNPFYVEEILSAAMAGPGVEPAGLRPPPPARAAQRAGRHQPRLPTSGRRVLEAAAICGPTTRFEVLARAADLGEDELLDLLRSLVRAGLLIEPTEDRFSFRHALVSEVVERQLLGRERRLLHQRA